MRILHVVPSFYPAVHYGGPMFALYGLCNALARQGVTIRVLTTDTAGPRRRVPVTSFPMRSPHGYPVFFCKRVILTSVSPTLLRHLVSQVRWADVVHLTAVYSFPTLPTLLACRLMDKPLVWSPRGSLQRWRGTTWPRLKAIWEWMCRLLTPERLVLHVTSQKEAEESLKSFPGLETAVIPNGVEIPRQASRIKEKTGLRLVYLGRLHAKKGIENLLQALTYLNGYLHDSWLLKLAGVGDGDYTKALQTRIERLGLSQQIEMVGEVLGDAKERLFENSDVLILPSHTENFGMVVAEALAHGVPVIASKGTPWQRVEEIGCGLWVENDPLSLAQAIERMSRAPLREMGEKGREWMKAEFSWEDRAKEMLTVYYSLVQKKEIAVGVSKP